MENELVRYSRAGDEFHYRWAARRCLKLIYPKSPLEKIVIEGSGPLEKELKGEYVIDVSEYSSSLNDTPQEIAYFQLKHTTVKKDDPFNLSDLRDTIEGFAARYVGHFGEDKSPKSFPVVTFSIVTNRPINESFKKNIVLISKGNMISNQDGKDSQFQKTIEKYTQLRGKQLQAFCASIEFDDSEGDYNVQREELRTELSLILAGTVDDPKIANIVELVRAKVMPDSDGEIKREEVLKRLGVTSERELFPAPPEFEELDNVIKREQHEALLKTILEAPTPIIIHAGGGVGKSVVARQLAESLPNGSVGIIYDCFGGGKYRNRSETRHRHRDALIQIANELATYGVCAPLIAESTTLEDQIMRQFLIRIEDAISTLKNANQDAILAIFIDAADNAEMAAQQFSQSCFVHEIIREKMPVGCHLVLLCRSERIHLLQPSNSNSQILLEPFTKDETFFHLKQQVTEVTEHDALEFYRLTGGNPRVQANALNGKIDGIAHILASLGPFGTTVEEQIEAQLTTAVASVKDKFPPDYQKHIDAICMGLAALPPFIPLIVLATVAEVNEAAVKSFVSDLGRPLWLSDTSVQFRDEPTETWFREEFSATTEQIASYVTKLKLLAQAHSYVAEALPALLLQAEKYEELVDLALSDKFLPNNPIDERNVRVYRLQFAFKAALKLERYADATKLALRAGEEVAGDKRQLELLSKNVDLIAPLQSKQRVQELAFRRLLRSGWDGSENVYSAALLSSVDDFKGEARGYLRAANNWLNLYFEERKKNKNSNQQEQLEDNDLVELTFACYNLLGVTKAVDFLLSWQPPIVVYRLASSFIRKLIDAGKFDAISEIAQIGSRNQYLMIAMARELLSVGQFPNGNTLQECLVLLATKRTRIAKPDYSYYDTSASAILAFVEACAIRELPTLQILRVLRHYFGLRGSHYVARKLQTAARNAFLRAVALKSVLSGNVEPDLGELLPEEWLKNEKKHDKSQDIQEFKEVIGALLPWYQLRARVLVNDEVGDLFESIYDADKRSKKARGSRWRDDNTLANEILDVYIEILILWQNANPLEVDRYFKEYLKENQQIWIQNRLKITRAAFRLNHLSEISRHLERAAFSAISTASGEGPETRAEWYIDLARAVLCIDRVEAAAYFDSAIEAISKFGDEIVRRWEAVAAIANRTAEGTYVSPEVAYRFIRCAELIGDNVAREKHFDRDGAIEICFRLSPPSAFAALSRWRDRDVGWFYPQIAALAFEVANSNVLSPTVSWSLSAFFDGYGLSDFAAACISHKSAQRCRQTIFNMAIRDLRLNEATEPSWKTLAEVAKKYYIDDTELKQILHFYSNEPEKENSEDNPLGRYTAHVDESEKIEWEKVFEGLELSTSIGLSYAIANFKKASTRYDEREAFWKEAYFRIDERDVVSFLEALVDAEEANKYDISFAISQMPTSWRNKVSVRRNWNRFIKAIAQRFATSFTNHHIRRDYFKAFGLQDDKDSIIQEGVLAGLSNYDDLADADAFFGFVKMGVSYVTPEEAYELLDYALARFEIHIDDEYADGNWAEWLVPPDSISIAFAGFVWSALGSPRSEIRWRAAHCVRRLADTNCVSEIDALIHWMESDEVGAFGSDKFPFYNLHARQYLLIAFARISLDNPSILKKHNHLFVQHALEKLEHVLIQKFSAEIALNIEKAFPKTYNSDVIEQLQKAGVSQLPLRESEHFYEDSFNSPWHERGEVNSELKFYHGLDFDSYWFEPLGRVFGISGKQVEELATKVIVNEWQVDNDGSYLADPRAYIWQSRQNEREIWYRHASYPRTDDLDFYLSSHSMFVIASRLLQQMPIVQGRDWYEDEWTAWLRRHMLTHADGYWLSDRRDPAPLVRRDWFYQKKSKDWRWEITPVDLLDGLFVERNGEVWLNVYGWWEDGDSEHEESFHVSTALVSPIASLSLLNALSTCPPNDFKLPDYEEERMEFDSPPFELKGWIWREENYGGLDEFDPLAGTIPYPPYQIGESVIKKLELLVGTDLREWYLSNADQASIICELWGTDKPRHDEDPLRQGRRLNASLAFLKKLCTAFGCEMIFEVQIERRFRQKPYASDKDGNEYAPPYYKIYVLSADGKLRDARTHFQLRESAS